MAHELFNSVSHIEIQHTQKLEQSYVTGYNTLLCHLLFVVFPISEGNWTNYLMSAYLPHSSR